VRPRFRSAARCCESLAVVDLPAHRRAEVHKLYRRHDQVLEHKGKALFDVLAGRWHDLFDVAPALAPGRLPVERPGRASPARKSMLGKLDDIAALRAAAGGK
jgi:hypothetical protein